MKQLCFGTDLLGSIRIGLMLSCREGMILVGLLAHLSNDFTLTWSPLSVKTLCPNVVTFRGAGGYDSNKSFFFSGKRGWGGGTIESIRMAFRALASLPQMECSLAQGLQAHFILRVAVVSIWAAKERTLLLSKPKRRLGRWLWGKHRSSTRGWCLRWWGPLSLLGDVGVALSERKKDKNSVCGRCKKESGTRGKMEDTGLNLKIVKNQNLGDSIVFHHTEFPKVRLQRKFNCNPFRSKCLAYIWRRALNRLLAFLCSVAKVDGFGLSTE